MNLRRYSPAWARAAVAICAIFAMLAVSAASSSAAHLHTKTPAGQCDICVTAHVAASGLIPIVPLANTPELREQFVTFYTVVGLRQIALRATLDRGPPCL